MTLHVAERTRAPSVVEVKLSGKLHRDDTRSLIPRFERVFEAHGSVRVLVDMTQLRGWIPGLLWEDLPVEALTYSHLERLAVVGDPRWQEAMATFCRPFSGARVRYFDLGDIDSARSWLEGP
jgi:hypothetical protein